MNFWNGFRYSLQVYLLEANSDKAVSRGSICGDDSLYVFLKDLDKKTDTAATTQLAVKLLTSFDATWYQTGLVSTIENINESDQLVDRNVLAASLRLLR